MGRLLSRLACLLLLCIVPSGAQLSGRVGPTTSTESKKKTVCNVLKYGAAADKTTDIGPRHPGGICRVQERGTGESTTFVCCVGTRT